MHLLSKLLLCVSLFFMTNCFADSAYVYCTNNHFKWHWLKQDGKKVLVTGEWLELPLSRNVFIEYFKVQGSEASINKLSQECIKQYGETYYIAQPAKGLFSDWYAFGTVDKLFNGLFLIKSYNFAYDFSLDFSSRDFYPADGQSYILKQDIIKKISNITEKII